MRGKRNLFWLSNTLYFNVVVISYREKLSERRLRDERKYERRFVLHLLMNPLSLPCRVEAATSATNDNCYDHPGGGFYFAGPFSW